MIDINTAWHIIYAEAERHYREQLEWESPVNRHLYRVSEFTNYRKPIVKIYRDKGDTDDNVSEDKVITLVTHLLNNSGRMPSIKGAIHLSSMDRAAVASIVHLHPFLDYEGERGSMDIVVRDTPKINLPGTATFASENERQLQKAAREVRRGQQAFRNRLIELYAGQCCISRTTVQNVLDAAHIIPYSKDGVTEESNGLLLRADIHNLFDDGLIQIHPESLAVSIDQSLRDSMYWNYNYTSLLPRIDGSRPSQEALIEKARLDLPV